MLTVTALDFFVPLHLEIARKKNSSFFQMMNVNPMQQPKNLTFKVIFKMLS